MNKRQDELLLIAKLREQLQAGSRLTAPTIRSICKDLNLNENRAEYIFQKWSDKAQWDYGLTPFGGWFTRLGLDTFNIISVTVDGN